MNEDYKEYEFGRAIYEEEVLKLISIGYSTRKAKRYLERQERLRANRGRK